jgi:hypothetical protein
LKCLFQARNMVDNVFVCYGYRFCLCDFGIGNIILEYSSCVGVRCPFSTLRFDVHMTPWSLLYSQGFYLISLEYASLFCCLALNLSQLSSSIIGPKIPVCSYLTFQFGDNWFSTSICY